MHFLALLNRDGGTLRTIDVEIFADFIRSELTQAGHRVDVRIVNGDEIVDALKVAAGDGQAEIILAGGGDGTISAAAAALKDSDKTLAILPAGTMNLFARGLGIPLSIEDAVRSFSDAEKRAVDVASANGRVFVHQFSVGMHPKVVSLRQKLEYKSRIGKIIASMRAAFATIMRPPRFRAELALNDIELLVTTSSIGITNNLFAEGHLPYAEMPDKGELGIYVTRAVRLTDILVFAFNMTIGRWRYNAQVEIHSAPSVDLTIRSSTKRHRASMDGELVPLEKTTRLEIHPGALRVLVPRPEIRPGADVS